MREQRLLEAQNGVHVVGNGLAAGRLFASAQVVRVRLTQLLERQVSVAAVFEQGEWGSEHVLLGRGETLDNSLHRGGRDGPLLVRFLSTTTITDNDT